MPNTQILLVEDDPAIAEMLIHLLENEGFILIKAETISDARKSLGENPFSAIILDVNLPDGNGFDFCKEIKKNSTTPILFLTCRGGDTEQTVGLQIADDYVVKPFSNTAVVERIKKIIKNKEGPESSLKDSKFHLDKDKQLITYQGETLDTTHAEYKILELLITNPGKVYSRESIYNFCWPDDPNIDKSDDFLRTIDTHIKTIRKKMGKINSQLKPEDIIKTKIKAGYLLDE